MTISGYDLSDRIVSGSVAIGTEIENETAVEAFHEAAVTVSFRACKNIQQIDPGAAGLECEVLVGTRTRSVCRPAGGNFEWPAFEKQ